MASEILAGLIVANLAMAAAIMAIVALRPVLKRAFGARTAYAAWTLAPLAGLAALLPARPAAELAPASPVRPLAERAVENLLIIAGPGQGADWGSLLLGLWLAGAVVGLAGLVAVQRRAMSSLGFDGADSAWRAVVGAQQGGPAVVGVFASRIVLPADFRTRYSAGERRLIFAHERAHLAGFDVQINALAAVIRCLFWFNPFIHLAAAKLRIDQELACDEAVMARFPAQRRTYAEALLKTQSASAPLPLGCYWPQRSHQHLKERLMLLIRKTPGRTRRIAGTAVLVALGLGTGYAAWADPGDQKFDIELPQEFVRVLEVPVYIGDDGIDSPPPAPREVEQTRRVGESEVVHFSGRRPPSGPTPEELSQRAAVNEALGLDANANMNINCLNSQCTLSVDGGEPTAIPHETMASLRERGLLGRPVSGGLPSRPPAGE